MARLNEPAAPVESVEALKRRFVRQNREIARANSTQSLRIRNLEAETSRLLTENLTLREQVINLQQELDYRPKRSVLEDLGLVKDKLDIKLAELGSLVFELGRAHSSAIADNSPPRRRSRKPSPKRSPDQKNWKNVLSLSEVTGRQDGRLPPIVEDKYYPRRTLNSEDLLGILNDPVNPAESPDLGPPPVAHFDDSDPVKHDGLQVSDSQGGIDELRASLAFMNLETRKKRRENYLNKGTGLDPSEVSLTSLEKTSMPTSTLSNQPLKLGAKRKLSVRDDEEPGNVPISSTTDGFRFNRRIEMTGVPNKDLKLHEPSSMVKSANWKVSQDIAAPNADSDKSRESTSVTSNNRKALREKSVNTDPIISPHKPSQALISDRIADLKKDMPRRAHERDRPRIKSSTLRPSRHELGSENEAKANLAENVLPHQVTTVISTTISTEPPPATPIYPDPHGFSPLSSQPSTARPESRDTPPPLDFHSAGSSSSTTIGRATRRPRGNVSYAEPSLRDKMRRPGKELVDAVGADERIQRAASVKPEATGQDEDPVGFNPHRNFHDLEILGDKAVMRSVIIKKEEGTEEGELNVAKTRQKERDKRVEPQSPLSAKSGNVAGLPASVLTDRKRRVSELQHNKSREQTSAPRENNHQVSNGASSSGSSVAIATLVAGTRGKQLIKERSVDGRDVAEGVADIYDFPGSSDAGATDGAARTNATDASIASDSKAREKIERIRHAKRASSAMDIKRVGERIEAAGVGVKTSTGSIRRRRRRETVSSAGSDGEGAPKTGTGAGESKLEAAGMRAERALTRRRSMMV